MTNIKIPNPQPKQWEFLTATARYVGYGGARGGGKSWAVRTKAKASCLKYPGIRVLILRRTYQDLLENHINILRAELSPIARYKESEKILTFVNGSVIKFGYCDCERDLGQYQGPEYDLVFLEEATQFPEDWFKILAACVRGINSFPKRLYLTCNPGGIGHAWVKRLFIERDYRGNENPDDYVFIPAKVTDNEILMRTNPEYIHFLDNLPADIREAWRDGNWDVFTGQFFTEWNRDIHVIEPFEIPAWWRLYITLDYGMDMLAAYLIAVNGEGEAFVVDEVYEGKDSGAGHNGLIISEAAERLKGLDAGRREGITFLAPPDLWNKRQETGRSAADIFGENGIDLIKTSNDRVDGWMAMREWMKPCAGTDGSPTARLRIFRGCVNLIRTLPQLMYDTKKPSDAAKEPHEVTHAPDAIRGFCVYWTSKAVRRGHGAPGASRPTKWTEDMWEDYNRAGSDGKKTLIGMWGEPK
ncbi:MAG: phage terminase large subunit [Oscillospiraceae bacterium]|nr:phage terminase large subunit [Oscillospiraceae bacterium]